LLVAFTVATALLGLVACDGPRAVSFKERREGFQFADFSVRPPAGLAWLVWWQNDQGVAFLHRRSKLHTIIAMAQLHRAPQRVGSTDDLRAMLEGRWKSEGEDLHFTTRHRNRRYELLPARPFGERCVRYVQQADDYGSPNLQLPPGTYLLLRLWGQACVLPARPNEVLLISYSERSFPAAATASFEQDADGFLLGFQLK
jgi:hypothetical protein